MTTNTPPDDLPLSHTSLKVRRLPLFTFLVFEQVLSTGSFTRAAEELGVSTGTVSKHVVRLEEAVGRTLTLRDPAIATPAGETVRVIARDIAAQACRLTQVVEPWR